MSVSPSSVKQTNRTIATTMMMKSRGRTIPTFERPHSGWNSLECERVKGRKQEAEERHKGPDLNSQGLEGLETITAATVCAALLCQARRVLSPYTHSFLQAHKAAEAGAAIISTLSAGS